MVTPAWKMGFLENMSFLLKCYSGLTKSTFFLVRACNNTSD